MNILQDTGQPPMKKNHQVQTVNGAEGEKPVLPEGLPVQDLRQLCSWCSQNSMVGERY